MFEEQLEEVRRDIQDENGEPVPVEVHMEERPQVEIQGGAIPMPGSLILPNSKRGDRVHLACSVVLEWLLESGNQEARDHAQNILDKWESEQDWIIAWGNQSHFFALLARAYQDPLSFAEMKVLAGNEGESVNRIVMLVERAVERIRADEETRKAALSPQPSNEKKPMRPISFSRYKSGKGRARTRLSRG